MNCLNCLYWLQKINNPLMGECRRYAPKPGSPAYWATTSHEHWCGDHKYEDEPLVKVRKSDIERYYYRNTKPGNPPPKDDEGK